MRVCNQKSLLFNHSFIACWIARQQVYVNIRWISNEFSIVFVVIVKVGGRKEDQISEFKILCFHHPYLLPPFLKYFVFFKETLCQFLKIQPYTKMKPIYEHNLKKFSSPFFHELKWIFSFAILAKNVIFAGLKILFLKQQNGKNLSIFLKLQFLA